MANIQNTDNCWQGCGTTENFHSLLVGKQNGTVPLEDSLAVSHKTKHIILSSNCILWYLPNELKTCPLSQKHMFSNFHNCPNLGATKMSFSKWIDK